MAALWADRVLPALAGLTKAMFQSADLVAIEGSTARIRVDNDHHRQNCERKVADVEKALAAELGNPITIAFEVGEGASARAAASAPAPRTVAPPVSDDPEEHLAGHDVHDLDDAPDAPSGGLAALTEAFPGAELIEET